MTDPPAHHGPWLHGDIPSGFDVPCNYFTEQNVVPQPKRFFNFHNIFPSYAFLRAILAVAYDFCVLLERLCHFRICHAFQNCMFLDPLKHTLCGFKLTALFFLKPLPDTLQSLLCPTFVNKKPKGMSNIQFSCCLVSEHLKFDRFDLIRWFVVFVD